MSQSGVLALVTLTDWNDKDFSIVYRNFSVGNKSTNFTLNIDKASAGL